MMYVFVILDDYERWDEVQNKEEDEVAEAVAHSRRVLMGVYAITCSYGPG